MIQLPCANAFGNYTEASSAIVMVAYISPPFALPYVIHFLLYHTCSKRKHAIAMVEKGTAQPLEDPYSGGGTTVSSHPTLTAMNSTSSMKNLLDDDIDVNATVMDNTSQ